MATEKRFYANKYSFVCYIFLNILFTTLLYDGKIYSQDQQTGIISKWYWAQPVPTGNLLYSVFFTDQNTGFAAGEYGTIIKTTDNGNSWNVRISNTSNHLSKVFFINNSTGFAAGKSGTIIKTTDNGNSWYNVYSNTNNNLTDISFTGRTTGYATGLRGTILKTTNTGISWKKLETGVEYSFQCISFLNENTGVAGGFNIILKTSDGGLSWSRQNLNLNPVCTVTGIFYSGYIENGNENIIYATADSPSGLFLKSLNGGISWTQSSLGLPALFGGSIDLVRSMAFKNINSGYIVTDYGTILRTTNSGIFWDKDSSFRPSYDKLSVMMDLNISGQENAAISGSGGTVLISTNSGNNWSAKSGNKKSIRDCKFINLKTGFCVGESGELLKSSNGGNTWITQNNFTGKFLNTLFFFDEKTGFVAGDSGAIFRTTDGAINWTDQTNFKKYDIKSIYFTDNKTGLAAGGYRDGERAFIFKTTDSGINWFEVYDSLSLGELNSLYFSDQFIGMAAGNNGNILRTFDNGYNWQCENIYSGNLYSISFSDPVNGLISGSDGLVFKTTDSGYNWHYIISGFYLNLYSIKYYGNELAVAAGERGTILFSQNGGSNWTIEPRITENNIYSVSMNKENKLFAVGDYGTILFSDFKNSKAITTVKPETKINSDQLFQNFPNPFNPSTVIRYKTEGENNFVKIIVYDTEGKKIASLVNDKPGAGIHSVTFEINSAEYDLPSGIYFYSLIINEKISGSGRMVYLK